MLLQQLLKQIVLHFESIYKVNLIKNIFEVNGNFLMLITNYNFCYFIFYNYCVIWHSRVMRITPNFLFAICWKPLKLYKLALNIRNIFILVARSSNIYKDWAISRKPTSMHFLDSLF